MGTTATRKHINSHNKHRRRQEQLEMKERQRAEERGEIYERVEANAAASPSPRNAAGTAKMRTG
jgi:hypothetical protein